MATCSTCGGFGVVPRYGRYGEEIGYKACPICHGKGKTAEPELVDKDADEQQVNEEVT